jgi:signal transduction histidine kinase
MTELMGLTNLSLNLVFLLLFWALLTQCMVLYFSKADPGTACAAVVFEALVLIYLAWLCWFVGVLKDNLFSLYDVLPGPDLRLAPLPAAALGFWLLRRTGRPRYGFTGAVLLILPFADLLATCRTAYLFSLLTALLVLLSGLELGRQFGETRRKITGLSVKEALDQLPDGLLFAGEAGQPVSVNRQITGMLGSLGLSAYERLDLLWEALSRRRQCSPELASPETLLLRREGGCLYAQKYPIQAGRASYQQIYIRDVTQEYGLTELLRAENRQLEENARELKLLLTQAETLAEKKEFLDSRARLHDVLSQRLSLVHALLGRVEEAPADGRFEEIRDLLKSIRRDLFDTYTPEPEAQLHQLVRIYRTMGAEVACRGKLPECPEAADAFTQILREAFSNALLHAGASRVCIVLEHDASFWSMTVKNNGYCPPGDLSEGNGIRNMRARLDPLRGSLAIETSPEFTVRVIIPSGCAEREPSAELPAPAEAGQGH